MSVTPVEYDPNLKSDPMQSAMEIESDSEATQIFTESEDENDNTPALRRTPSTLVIETHHDLPKGATVKLRPVIETTADGTITRMLVSPLQRTPSPFGSRMGDHTVSWQAVVDSVHALVHGLSLREASAALRAKHVAASSWMADRMSYGKQLFRLLPDSPTRAPRLEDSAARALEALIWADHLAGQDSPAANSRADVETVRSDKGEEQDDTSDTARRKKRKNESEQSAAPPQKVNQAKVREQLQLAVAQHLAFLNYVPFATVPTPSTRGSKGSGEGTRRKIILEVEKRVDLGALKEGDALPAITPGEAEAVRQALWGLFAFDAALRESQAELVLLPSRITLALDTRDQLQHLADQVIAMMAGEEIPLNTNEAEPEAYTIETLAGQIAKGKEDYQEVFAAACVIRDAAKDVPTQSLMTGAPKRNAIAEFKELITARMQALDALCDHLATKQDLRGEAAAILAHLLHHHQSTVAAAYPYAVRASGFLGKNPADAAVTQLEAEIRKWILGAPPVLDKPKRGQLAETVDRMKLAFKDSQANYAARKLEMEKNLPDLVAAFRDKYRQAGHEPVCAARNGWARDALQRQLVVTCATDGTLTINGRAPAPKGVAGMGSHTTAWLVETLAVSKMLSPHQMDKKPKAIRDEVIRSLESKVMELAAWLPIEQLESDHLTDMYDAALQALKATDVETAVAGYLTFRNLMPYATVDAGDRGGHGEQHDRVSTYDRKSLTDAAGLQRSALASEAGRREHSAALLEQAALLEAQSAAWATPVKLKQSVNKTIKRLRVVGAQLMDDGAPDVSRLILKIRGAEHEFMCDLAGLD